MRLQFLGAAGTVTGSRTLVENGRTKVLVDCGLFQGFKNLRLKNREDFPIQPSEIDAVVLTHAHLDHSGYIPLLVKSGFRGKIYCTAATRDLCSILLPDSGYLQEEEAKFANKHGFSKHHPAVPLYTAAEAKASLEWLTPVNWQEPVSIGAEGASRITIEFHPAGHLLGAASVLLKAGSESMLFSGDLGREADPTLKPPAAVARASTVIIESTYGDRKHAQEDPAEAIAEIVRRTHARGGVLLIPTFAVGRAQLLLYYLHQLTRSGAIPQQPIYLNSPMASQANQIFMKNAKECRLSASVLEDVCQLPIVIGTVEESRALNEKKGPMIILAASGMATGGRVLHHLKAFAGEARNTILFAGFQAGGTRGEALANGAKEIKIHGALWPVRAEVIKLDSLSAHADRDGLLAWLEHLPGRPRRIFVNHGESAAAESFANLLRERFHVEVVVPEAEQKFEIS